jgi:hypothetical protein
VSGASRSGMLEKGRVPALAMSVSLGWIVAILAV